MSEAERFWPTPAWVEAHLELRRELDRLESLCCRERVLSLDAIGFRCCGCGKPCLAVPVADAHHDLP